MHRCDNPPCVNPAHLTLGTLADNSADMVSKGRQAKGVTIAVHKLGQKNHFAKLSDADAAAVRKRYASGELANLLAAEYGVSRPTITRCVNGRTFGHLPGAIPRKTSAEACEVGHQIRRARAARPKETE